MTKVISFSLWGDNPKYCVGAVRNVELAREIYPDWISRFYIGSSVPSDINIALLQTGGNGWEEIEYRKDILRPYRKWASGDGLTELVCYNEPGDWRMMLDRFQPIEENGVEAMISRDCDSRLSWREKEAVDEWLASDKVFHTMHCHWHHSVPILGGMFGVKTGQVGFEMVADARKWARSCGSRWQCDQDFLTAEVWPYVKDITMNHADFHTNIWPGRPFPSPMTPGHFIGATYNERDEIDQAQLRCLHG